MMTVSGYTGEERLENFPVPVRISTGKISGFRYDKCDGEDDISFSDEDGKILAHEVEVWDTEGESVAWVSLPVMTNNAVFYMNWSHKTKLAEVKSNEVWTSANYVGVWHMNEYDSDNKVQRDSTGHGFNATYASMSNGSVSTINAAIGKAFRRTNASKDKNVASTSYYLRTPSTVSSAMNMEWKTGCSFSGWVYWDGFDATGSNASYWMFYINPSTSTYYWGAVSNNRKVSKKFKTTTPTALGDGTNPANGWFNLTITVTNNVANYFINGKNMNSPSGSLSGDYIKYATYTEWRVTGTTGYLDEIRYRNGGAVSEDWIKAEYDSVKNLEFVVASPAVYSGPGLFIIVR